MGSDIAIMAVSVDIDGFLVALAAAAGRSLAVEVSETAFAGLATTIWGRRLPADRDDLWEEAQLEAEMGESSIETIRPLDGSGSYDIALLRGPYRERTLAGLQTYGDPAFWYASEFVRADCRWDGGELVFGFDRRLGCTASLFGSIRSLQGPATLISTCDEYLGLDHRARASDHITAVGLLDILARYGQLEVIDTSGYFQDRDEIALIGAMVLERQIRSELRAALGALNGPPVA